MSKTNELQDLFLARASRAREPVTMFLMNGFQMRGRITGFDAFVVVLVKPDRFENAAEIADHLREKRTVVLNLEQTNKEVSRRILDFLSGAAYAQEGKVKKVALSTYIITPYNVDILGDLIDELENNGLYF